MKLSSEAVDAIATSYARINGQMTIAKPEWHRVTMSAEHAGVPPSGSTVTMLYTNWRGKTAIRTVIIERHWYGNTDWHPEQQNMFTAYEPATGMTRDFAVAGVKDWNAEIVR